MASGPQQRDLDQKRQQGYEDDRKGRDKGKDDEYECQNNCFDLLKRFWTFSFGRGKIQVREKNVPRSGLFKGPTKDTGSARDRSHVRCNKTELNQPIRRDSVANEVVSLGREL